MEAIYKVLESIFTGSVAGIAAGLVLARYFKTANEKRETLERETQKDYITNLVVKYRTSIICLKLSKEIPAPQNRESKDSIRQEFYHYFRRELESALSGRSNRLTFDEVEEMKKLFRIGTYEWNTNEALYEYEYIEMFQKAESIKWLNVPPMT